MTHQLCFYHNNDLGLKGVKMGFDEEIHEHVPEISCNGCRARGYFKQEDIEEYEADLKAGTAKPQWATDYKTVLTIVRFEEGY